MKHFVLLLALLSSGVIAADQRCDAYSGKKNAQCKQVVRACIDNPTSKQCINKARNFLDKYAGSIHQVNTALEDEFVCNGFSYLVQGNGGSDLIRFNPYGDEGEFTSLWADDIYPREIQAIGYRESDGYYYGWDTVLRLPIRIKNTSSSSTSVEPLPAQIPDATFSTVSGDVIGDELYLFRDGVSYKLNLSSLVWTKIVGATGNYAPDMAFLPSKSTEVKKVAYGVNELGQVVKFTDDNGSYTFSVVGQAPFSDIEPSKSWGGAYAERQSTYLYVSNNGGPIYKINVDNLSDYEKVGDTNTSVVNNDGGHCAESFVGSFHLYYVNNIIGGSSAGNLVENASDVLVNIGTTSSGFATEFTEQSNEMIQNGVTPGVIRSVGFNYEGENINCGDVNFRGPVIAVLEESSEKAGVRSCTLHYQDDYISITNSTGSYYYPAFDSATTTDWFADSAYGWLLPQQTRVYWGYDPFLTHPSVNIQPGDTIEKIGYTDGVNYYECDTNVVYRGQLRYDIVNSGGETVCVKR